MTSTDLERREVSLRWLQKLVVTISFVDWLTARLLTTSSRLLQADNASSDSKLMLSLSATQSGVKFDSSLTKPLHAAVVTSGGGRFHSEICVAPTGTYVTAYHRLKRNVMVQKINTG